MKVDTFPIFESTIKFIKPLVHLKVIYYSFLFSDVFARDNNHLPAAYFFLLPVPLPSLYHNSIQSDILLDFL